MKELSNYLTLRILDPIKLFVGTKDISRRSSKQNIYIFKILIHTLLAVMGLAMLMDPTPANRRPPSYSLPNVIRGN